MQLATYHKSCCVDLAISIAVIHCDLWQMQQSSLLMAQVAVDLIACKFVCVQAIVDRQSMRAIESDRREVAALQSASFLYRVNEIHLLKVVIDDAFPLAQGRSC